MEAQPKIGVEPFDQTTLAAGVLIRAPAAGVPAPWVTGDEVYGADPALRAELEPQRVGYVLEPSSAADDRVVVRASTLIRRRIEDQRDAAVAVDTVAVLEPAPPNPRREPGGGPQRPLLAFPDAVQEDEEVVPVNAVSTWVLPSGVTVGR